MLAVGAAQNSVRADGIYPNSMIFGKTMCDPFTKKKASFSKCQESCRKDVEWEFYVLQDQFSIIWYLIIPMVDDSDMGGHEYMFDHVQHDHEV
jgi:hypothetical protein